MFLTPDFCVTYYEVILIQISMLGGNDRGISFTFGGEIVSNFLRKDDLDLICRAHQVVEDEYEFFAKRQLITVFPAPNYLENSIAQGQ